MPTYNKRELARIADHKNRIQPDWAGWIKYTKGQCIRILRREAHPIEKENGEQGDTYGPSVVLSWPGTRNGGSGMTIDLTDMTELELLAFKYFINETCELAQPICRLRDEQANRAYEQGSDDFDRLYRSPPEIFTRSWARNLNSESLRSRLAWDAAAFKPNGSEPEPVFSTSTDVSESLESNSASTHDAT